MLVVSQPAFGIIRIKVLLPFRFLSYCKLGRLFTPREEIDVARNLATNKLMGVKFPP